MQTIATSTAAKSIAVLRAATLVEAFMMWSPVRSIVMLLSPGKDAAADGDGGDGDDDDGEDCDAGGGGKEKTVRII